jgi:diguanylate cyclase (GGDEF)-like protein
VWIYLKRLWQKWRYYSFEPDAVRSCFPQIRLHNLHILRVASLIAVIFPILFIFYPLLIKKNISEVFVFIIIVIIEYGVFSYANYQRKKPYPVKDYVFFAYCFYFFSMLFFGVYIEFAFSSIIPSLNFYLFLLFSQILFIFDPILNLFVHLTVLIFFCILSLKYNLLDILKQNIVSGIIAGVVGMVFSWYASYIMIREMITAKKLEEERGRFKEQSIKDELTGLSNRRDFLNSVKFYIAVCQHVHQTVCVIMMDVDHFKKYNDFYGHAQGDLVLKMMGKVLSKFVQEESVFAARIGGEEFIILWTENRLSEAEYLALKLKQAINDLQIPHAKSDVAPHVTASYGLYFLRGGSMDTADELYEKADRASYEAKSQGRNRIILLDSDEPSVFRHVG